MAPVRKRDSAVKNGKNNAKPSGPRAGPPPAPHGSASSSSSSSEDSRTIKVFVNGKKITFSIEMLAHIKRLQTSTRVQIPKLPFSRLVREVSQDHGQFMWNAEAMEALQVSAEMFLTQFFQDTNKCAMHAKRVTIQPPDMNLVRDIRDYCNQ